jgi:conjugative transfer signal peptidase TraF
MCRRGLDLLAATGVIVAARRCRRSRFVMLAGAVAVAALALPAALHPIPRLIWHATASAPIGLYRVNPSSPIRRGDLVLVTPPDTARRLAAERGYLPAGVPLVKLVVAISGDLVCVDGGEVRIGGRHVAWTLSADRQGRPLPQWDGCRSLLDGEVFLLMADVPDSFDSRYFGPVERGQIIGRLAPLWTR